VRSFALGAALAAVVSCGGVASRDTSAVSEAPDPLASAVAAGPLGSLVGLDPQTRRLYDDRVNFEPLPPAAEGSWRDRFPGPGQSYDEFLARRPNVPDAGNDRLYLLPLGKLPADFVVESDQVVLVRSPEPESMRSFLSTFYGLPTAVLEETEIGALARPVRVRDGHEQFLAQSVLTGMLGRLPEDAYSLTALATRDLFFHPAQQYGFGYGMHKDRLAVLSFARLDPMFAGAARPPDVLEQLPRRGYKLLAHEVGHTFGLEHCTEYACVMNGFIDVEELDETPLHLGPQCLRKLTALMTELDPRERYVALEAFYAEHGLPDEQAWVQSRLLHLEG
jgi:archaemetzincin